MSALRSVLVVVLVLIAIASIARPASAQATDTAPVIVVQPPSATPSTTTEPCPADLECEIGADRAMHRYRHERTRLDDPPLLVGGALMFGGAWLVNGLASGVVALIGGFPGSYFLWSTIPLVGPLVQMGFTNGHDYAIAILAVMDAIEIGGLIMAILGQIGSVVDVRTEIAGVSIVPWALPSGAGAIARGDF